MYMYSYDDLHFIYPNGTNPLVSPTLATTANPMGHT